MILGQTFRFVLRPHLRLSRDPRKNIIALIIALIRERTALLRYDSAF